MRLVTTLEPQELAQIEDEVAEIFRSVPDWVWDGKSLPVPVDLIARELYGLRVRAVSVEAMREAIGEDPDGHFGLSGLLLSGDGEIWVSQDELNYDWGESRHRFTVGHELGHFVMHQSRRPRVFCREVGNDEFEHEVRDENAPVPRPVPEAEANTFSAAVLMPADLIRAGMEDGQVDDDGLLRLMEKFGTSDKAMRRRVETLRVIA